MTSSAHFPINDLKRRRLQSTLVTLTLTLSVASTLFLLLYSNRLGVGIAANATGALTLGLTAIFGQFLLFIGVLVFAIGAVLTTFVVFLMMAQRTRDFGLIKAAGCPNSLVAGYFMTELLAVTLIGCLLGVAAGFVADFAVSNAIFSSYDLPNWWFAPLVFVIFFLLAVIFGIQPLLKASKISAVEALSPISYYGLVTEKRHKPLSRKRITWRLASRSLGRRQTVGVRVVFLLSIVFVLLTVSVGGGIIASGTTISWVEQASGGSVVALAHRSMGEQYLVLLSQFSGGIKTGDFNYLAPELGISEGTIDKISSLPNVSMVDARLVVKQHLHEVSNFTIIDSETYPVGDDREGDAIVVGVNTENLLGSWSLKGRFLSQNGTLEAVIGDSVSQSMFYGHPKRYVVLSDPLVEGISFQNTTFDIVGICVDPLNSGQVAYVPIETLKNATGFSNPNLLLVKLNNVNNKNQAIQQIKTVAQTMDPNLEVFDLAPVTQQNVAFLSSTWRTIMLVPALSLVSATLCLVGYMMLAVEEQRQEFGILRAVGAKPKIIVNICAIQSAVLLSGSFGVGITVGIMVTLVFLMANPLVTAITIMEIAVWLAAALVGMFLLSLYPAFKLAKTSILESLT